ncbi:MAG: hypothetical protein PHP29_06575, partial [Tissierellia bacterium]|nr:hypothetical protein [Tissierellia bacterium]
MDKTLRNERNNFKVEYTNIKKGQKMKKENFNFIIAALILLNIYTIFKLNSMERTLDYNVQYLDREQRNLSREIDDIYFNVD